MQPFAPAVLVVEDEAFVRMVAVDVLSYLGVPLYEAADAGEALHLLEDHPDIGLIFTDINMPGDMDGLRLAHHVHEARPNVRLVVTSGKHRLSASGLPDDGVFLPKPYRAQELVSVVQRQLQH